MDLNLTPAEQKFRDEFREWLAANVPPPWSGAVTSENRDDHIAYLSKWQRTLFEGGWAGIAWPKQYGGRGATLMTFASGRPFTPLAGVDLNGDGDGGAFPSDRARTNPADPSTSVRRNSERMKSGYSIDLRLSKRFAMAAGRGLDAMFDVFNVTNHTNFSEINNIFGTGAYPTNPVPTYKQYTAASAGRQFQLGAKFTF